MCWGTSEPGTAAGCRFSSRDRTAAEERQKSLPAPRGAERGGVSVGPVVRLRIVRLRLPAPFWKFPRAAWTTTARLSSGESDPDPAARLRHPLHPLHPLTSGADAPNLSRAAAAAGRKGRARVRRAVTAARRTPTGNVLVF